MTNDIQTFTKEAGKKLKSARTRKNFQISQLASKSGVSSDIITRLEDGTHAEIRLKALVAIVIALGIDFTELSI